MSQDREPMRRELTLHSLFGHLWLLALFGGLIALFTSINSEFSPYFYWPYSVPAVIAVIAVVAWALWRDVSTRTKQLLAGLLVLAGAWLIIGPWLSGFANLDFMPATRASILAGGILESVEAGGLEATEQIVSRAFAASAVNTVTLTGAGVGGFMLVFSGIGSWLTRRSMAESRAREASPSYATQPEGFYGGEPEKAY